ncbi:MAG: SusC/RagA family TonB-linked outer membrane protein [Candidatus Pedobacter colombiensis]|uniref:SusC/RagA family TonB-linked outer membrane protein n=1 Tax=Candidatus Pedobacter colombiensis TaxID=3121371 RepID=A0AAJ6B5P9_9SPHI|nr:SusC/RagA family TonB-linked outer membrane protein [Pedobacter sp.]WEK18992.1 MAG: SusC/RagA family TonB-linked outer membrane protein [Pedobacter sp.]
MNFYMTFKYSLLGRIYANILLKLKLTFIILISVILNASATGYAQITLKENGAPLEQVIQKIRKQAGYELFYNAGMLAKARPVTLNVNNASVEQVLDLCFKDQPLTYSIKDKTIIVKNRLVEVVVIKDLPIRGRVLDENGKPIPGASIRVKGTPGLVTASTVDGSFKINVNTENDILLVSYVGYKTQEIKLKANQGPLTIKMEVSENNMKDVVITGMMTVKKESFSGATASFSGEDLKAIGNVNVIQSLRTLDPSFLLMENNITGSNPNVLPTIELRGQTSITTQGLRDEFSNDPNQPLFILDGFETSLKSIVDLDMNRVASISILKDAASTAVYGSRASNGVIVIETIRPKAGELNLTYTTDGNIDFADLSSYNLMNAREKLEFERLSGRYIIHPRFGTPIQQMALDDLYASRLKDVEKGIDSYWLNEPIQTGYAQRHSISVSGGEKDITYSVGGDIRNVEGSMIGSGRKTWGTRLNLTYRNSKINISNMLYVNGYNSKESNYGDFSKWANMNPYFDKTTASGRYLLELQNPFQPSLFERVENPYYATTLGSFDREKNFSLTNNTQARYNINKSLLITASFQIVKGTTEANKFISPLDNKYVSASALEKGSLTNSTTNNLGLTGNIALNYSKVINKHSITGMLRTEVSNVEYNRNGYIAVGFPNSSNGNARFAYGFAENGRPAVSQTTSRRNSIISSANYSYDNRLNFDASFTYDGTTSFGNANKYSPFFSIGSSWNLHNEGFLKKEEWIDLLRVRANFGITGNQNFSSYTSVSTYNFDTNYNYFGQGLYLSSLGNENLKWQNTYNTSLGIDAAFWKNRLNVQLNGYRKYTDPLVVAVSLPPSTALTAYPINAGTLDVKGLEAIIRVSPIYNPTKGTVWTLGLTASHYTQRYDNFNNILEGLNEGLRKSKSLTRYRDGGDPADIWTVPSLGIDPANGNEIFLKKDGSYSYEYDYKDQVVVGNTRPKLEGVFSSTLSFKNFNFGLNFRYILGQDIFNSALFNKVENISMSQLLTNNQDKRALYDRWKTPGDVSEFRNISIIDRTAYQGLIYNTEMSSRFVQRENSLTLEAANLGYNFRDRSWMKQARLTNLRLNAFTGEIFRISTVKRERGISYPYARTVSFSLTANFQ